MNNIFCTLFNKSYIDKGIALINSLECVSDCYRIYILAMDEDCHRILKELNFKNVRLISLDEFETNELLSVKNNRSTAEYCWTCTPLLIKYILERYQEKICTYIDSDIYFFSNPEVLFNEMDPETSVLITSHRFPNSRNGRKSISKYGKYCVQFNTFRNDYYGKLVLNWWADKCLDWCYAKNEIDRMGDQKYLNKWPETFEGVKEIENMGAGVAYWNLEQYYLLRAENGKILLASKKKEQKFEVVFCHFQNIKYIGNHYVNLRTNLHDKMLKRALYYPYLLEVEKSRSMLKEKFGLIFLSDRATSGKKIVAIAQRYFAKYKVTNTSDIVDLRKLRA